MSDSTGVSYVTQQFGKIQAFVTAGGKVYNSCTCALWTEGTFPPYLEYYGADDPIKFDIGRISSFGYSTTGEVLDQSLANWLEVVTDEDVNAFPFQNGYVKIDATVPTDDGNGLEEDDYWVVPYTWILDNSAYPNSPLMVTYNYQAGKVFYTVYETSGLGAGITPQEFALLYVILEVGISTNPPPPPT